MDPSGWLNRRQADGGVDRVDLPDGVPGSLWLCGKHAVGPDHHRLIEEVGAPATIVCLVERHEIEARYPAYVAWLDRPGATDAVWRPIADLHAPDPAWMLPFVDDLVARLDRGETLIVHCGAGMGRAGTVAMCILVRLGASPAYAQAIVADARPGAGPEVGAQHQLVEAIAAIGNGADDGPT